MSTTQSLQQCNVLLVGNDMEWNHAYISRLKRLFVVEEKTCEQSWQVRDIVQVRRPNLIVLVNVDVVESMKTLRNDLADYSPSIPIIAVAQSEEGDNVMKAGVDFYVHRTDVFAAIQYTQRIVRDSKREHELTQAQDEAHTLQELNSGLYRNAPDPICFVQDGLFMDANAAFLQAFNIASQEVLDELTLLSLATPRSAAILKDLLKNVATKGLTSTESLDMQTPSGDKRQFVCTASQVDYKGEPAIQLQWRGANAAGVGIADKTTGLMGFSVLQQAIAREKENNRDAESFGHWIYLWVENYREVWAQDGYQAAEILIGFVADGTARYMPSSTITVRFTDDALIMLVQGERHSAVERVEKLIEQLKDQVPENIGRMIHPSLYVSIETVTQETTDITLLSGSYRSVRNLALSQTSERISVDSGTMKISRNDERRLAMLQKALDESRIHVRYQPITHLEADGVARFATILELEPDTDAAEEVELEGLITIAERYGKSEVIDKMKLDTFLRDILSYDGNQQNINGYVAISAQSVQDEAFPEWILNQLKQTGIIPSQLNFEITLDVAINAFSGVMNFAQKMRRAGAHIVLSEITRFDDEVKELAERIQPDILKLDMREIDTFEDDEEERFMTTLKEYAEEHKQTIIVDHMESPAQLSRVWPYGLQLLQGDGMITPMNDFNFNFSEALF